MTTLLIAEHDNAHLKDATHKALTAAKALGAPVHVLVIPRIHVTALWDLEEKHGPLMSRLLLACNDVASSEGIDQSGYRVVVNAGPNAGQSVDHLHLHVLGGQRMGWPPFPAPAAGAGEE